MENEDSNEAAEGAKRIASPFLTGGGGLHFEENVQTSFVVLMLSGGFAPCIDNRAIKSIHSQTKHLGYETDDLLVCSESPNGSQKRKLLGQVKHSIAITDNEKLGEVIGSAWRDFNNEKLFKKGKDGDLIALITGPLSATDINSVRPILEKARSGTSCEVFFSDINKSFLTSDKTREKLNVIRGHLNKANGSDLTDDEVFEFLQHYHLLQYDLDIRTGVNRSLINTILRNRTGTDPYSLWARIKVEVEHANQNAGALTRESIPSEILDYFDKPRLNQIPKDLALAPKPTSSKRSWAQDTRFRSLAIACLIGQWREDSEADCAIIDKFLSDGYASWLRDIRSILQEADSPLKLKNGYWSVINRSDLWSEICGCIFDEDLENLQSAAETVLSEIDPKFEIPVDKRLFNFEGKKKEYSDTLRKGLAEALAYLGRKGDALNQCSCHKPRTVALLATRKILESEDYRLWGSLNNLLPLLAEASPDEFLKAIETKTTLPSSPFLELFNQETGGAFSQNYLTGLWWGLELLAWEDPYLIRATVLLASLSEIDPGGQYSNRPENSLTEIYLPWMPQTLASFDRQIIAMNTLRHEHPSTLKKLLLSLLPKGHGASSGTYSPKFLEISEELKSPRITNSEYWKRVTEIADLAFELGTTDRYYLQKFVAEIDHLPIEFQNRIVSFLHSDDAQQLFDDDFSSVWKVLSSMVLRHRKHSDTDWALPAERVDDLDKFVQTIAPQSLTKLSERLFRQDEFDLYEETGDWQAQRDKIQEQRNEAIKSLIETEGLEAVIEFSNTVEAPYRVGFSLGSISNSEIDDAVLPVHLNEKVSPFAHGYINARHHSAPWSWVDNLDKSRWNSEQLLGLCLSLPFTSETWNRADNWLANDSVDYWVQVEFNPHQADGDLLPAVDALLTAGRPLRAIDCLHCRHFNKEALDIPRTVKSLWDAVNTKESAARMDQYDIIQLISALQDDQNTPEEDLVRIEWAYLRLLDPHSGGEPKTLFRKLSSEPQFFCEILRLVYKSDRAIETTSEPDESTKMIAQNAWHLLHNWNRAPGVDESSNLESQTFNNWVTQAINECSRTGHLEIGLSQIGKALFYAPAETNSSLWIAKSAALVLNHPAYKEMRSGFRCEAYNSRGCHTPSSSASMDLHDQWLAKAESVEAEGFHRFAAELRSLSDEYKSEAETLN